jgi:hypothetical protein
VLYRVVFVKEKSIRVGDFTNIPGGDKTMEMLTKNLQVQLFRSISFGDNPSIPSYKLYLKREIVIKHFFPPADQRSATGEAGHHLQPAKCIEKSVLE